MLTCVKQSVITDFNIEYVRFAKAKKGFLKYLQLGKIECVYIFLLKCNDYSSELFVFWGKKPEAEKGHSHGMPGGMDGMGGMGGMM